MAATPVMSTLSWLSIRNRRPPSQPAGLPAGPMAASRSRVNFMNPTPPGGFDPYATGGRGHLGFHAGVSRSGRPSGLCEGADVSVRVGFFADPEHGRVRSGHPRCVLEPQRDTSEKGGECGASAQGVRTGGRWTNLTRSGEGPTGARVAWGWDWGIRTAETGGEARWSPRTRQRERCV